MLSIPCSTSPPPTPLKNEPIFDSNALIFMTKKYGSMKRKVLHLLGSGVVFTPKMVEAARKMYEDGEFGPAKLKLKYHVAPEFHDPHMIPLFGFQGWEHNPAYTMEHPRKVDLLTVKPKRALNLSRKSKMYRKCKNSWYQQMSKKKERVTKLREQLSRIEIEWKMAKQLNIPPTTERRRGFLAARGNNYVMWKKWQVKQIQLGKVTRRLPPPPTSPEPRHSPTPPPQRPSSPPEETEAQRRRRIVREIGESLNSTIPEYQKRLMREADRETRAYIKEQERRKDPNYLKMLWEKRVDDAEAGARERARLKAEWLSGQAVVLEPTKGPVPVVALPKPSEPSELSESLQTIMEQCDKCLNDMIGLTVCQELIPQLTSIQERYNVHDDEWKPTLCFKHPEHEEDLVEQLIKEVEKGSDAPLFAVMSTFRETQKKEQEIWWSIPLIPFLEMKIRNIRAPRAGAFRAFTPSPHGCLEEFKRALCENMHHRTGKRTLPSDKFECHSATHLKHMFFLEFYRHKERLLEEANVIEHLCPYRSEVLQVTTDNPYETGYKKWKSRVEELCREKGGKYRWREHGVDWESLPPFVYPTDRERWEKRFERVMGKKMMNLKRAVEPGPIRRAETPPPFFGGQKSMEELTFHEFIAMYKTSIFRVKQLNADPYLSYQERQSAIEAITEDLDMGYFQALQSRLEEPRKSHQKSNYGRVGEMEARLNYRRRLALEELEARKLELPSKAAYEEELERIRNHHDAPGASCSSSTMLHEYHFDPYRYATVQKINEYGEDYPISSAPGVLEQKNETDIRLRKVAKQLEELYEWQEDNSDCELYNIEATTEKIERRERQRALYERFDRERNAKKVKQEIEDQKDTLWLEKEQLKWEGQDLKNIMETLKKRKEGEETRREKWRAERNEVKNKREAERIEKARQKLLEARRLKALKEMEAYSSSEDLDPQDYRPRFKILEMHSDEISTRYEMTCTLVPEPDEPQDPEDVIHFYQRPLTPFSNDGNDDPHRDLDENPPFDDGAEEPVGMEQDDPEMVKIGLPGYFTPESPGQEEVVLEDHEIQKLFEDALRAGIRALENDPDDALDEAPEDAPEDNNLYDYQALLEEAPGAQDPEEPEDERDLEDAPEDAPEDDNLLDYQALLEPAPGAAQNPDELDDERVLGNALNEAPEDAPEDNNLYDYQALLEDDLGAQDPEEPDDERAPEHAPEDAPNDDPEDNNLLDYQALLEPAPEAQDPEEPEDEGALHDAPEDALEADVLLDHEAEEHQDFDNEGAPEDGPEYIPEDDDVPPNRSASPTAALSPTETSESPVRTRSSSPSAGNPTLPPTPDPSPESDEEYARQEALVQYEEEELLAEPAGPVEPLQVIGEILTLQGDQLVYVAVPEDYDTEPGVQGASGAVEDAPEAQAAREPEERAPEAQSAQEPEDGAPEDQGAPEDAPAADDAQVTPEPEEDVPEDQVEQAVEQEEPVIEPKPVKKRKLLFELPDIKHTARFASPTPPPRTDSAPVSQPTEPPKKKHAGGRPRGPKKAVKVEAVRKQPRRSVKKVDSQDAPEEVAPEQVAPVAPEDDEVNALLVPMIRTDIAGFMNEPDPVQDLSVDLDVHIPTVARTVSISTNEELLLAEQELLNEPGPSQVFNEEELLGEVEHVPEPVPEQEPEQEPVAEVLNTAEAEQELDALEPELIAPAPKKRGRKPKRVPPACRNPKKGANARRNHTLDTDTLSMISSLSARSKKNYISANNPRPRRRIRGMATMPEGSRITGVAPKETEATEPEPEHVDEVEDILKKKTAPAPSVVEVDEEGVEPEAEPVIKEELEEHWAAPPPHTTTSRKSRKRQREERQAAIQQEVKQELYGEPPATPDPDIEVTMYTMKRIKQELDEELEECMIVAANYHVPHVSVAVEQPPTDAKEMVVGDGVEAILTKKVWTALNEFFRSDPERFSEIMLVLDSDSEKRGRVFKKDASVVNRTSEFTVNFIDFMANSPRTIKLAMQNLTSYSNFSSALRDRASLILSDHHITPVILFRIVERIPEIKKVLRDQCSVSLVGENERDAMLATENILLGRYIESVMKLTALSQVTWASENHVKRRIELIYNGWNMFLGNGGFFRVLLALDRPDVKPISAGFRKYCEEYLADIEAIYKKAVELLKMTPDEFLEHLCELTGLTMEQVGEMEEDAATVPSDKNSHKCARCYLADTPVYFSSYTLLEQHDKLHEAGSKECGLCFDEFPAPEYIMHRISHHCSMKLQEDEEDDEDL